MKTGQCRGFSLIELMIAMVAGSIVTAAMLTFTVSVLRSNTQNIEATRLTQELRNVMDYASRELRRAGYDENAIRMINNVSGYNSPFRGIGITGSDCVVYGYDRDGGTDGSPDAGEVRGIRRITLASGVGVIEVHRGGGTSAPSCTGAAGVYTTFPAGCSSTSHWCPLTDARSVDITGFSVTRTNSTAGSGPAVRTRRLLVTVTGSLVSASDTVRQMSTTIRVRADCVSATTAGLSACDTAPVL